MKKRLNPGSAHLFTSILEPSDNRVWGCHFRVPARIAERLIEGLDRRVLCSINGTPERACGILHRGPGLYLITVNKKLRTDLDLDLGAKVRVTLRKDRTEYGLPMPEELRIALAQDDVGRRWFDRLTPGKRRTLLYMVNSVKSPDVRIRRALLIVDHLKANGGKIDYRQLTESMKNPRRTL